MAMVCERDCIGWSPKGNCGEWPRKKRGSLVIEQLRILFDHLLNQFPGLDDLGGGHFFATGLDPAF